MNEQMSLRESNPRLISRQSWWIELARWNVGETAGPPCTECGDTMLDAQFVGAQVCVECAPYVPESERSL